ncbi:MAG: GntR family transcriptional regulator [Deltaproteobacteria bacterium]|jgi:GntR family transcriptional regulator|nr:GntR family transcriptional regulator [Deltaproteobacteria bacterium]
MRNPPTILEPNVNIKIKSAVKGPAYIQLATLIKDKISSGEFTPGMRIPAEVAISKTYGVAVMTVRQAIHVLAEQGLLRRVHGSGTFVCGPDWTRANFNMEGLLDRLEDQDNVEIQILSAGMSEASEKAAESLEIEPGAMILSMIRLVSHKGRPFLLNKARLKYDPKSPIVEAEMEASSLSSLFTGQKNSFAKKSVLRLEPYVLTESEASLLQTQANLPAFKIRYTFYGYADEPVGTGWFMTPMEFISFTTKIGVWDEE